MLNKSLRLNLPSDFYKLKKYGNKINSKYFNFVYLNNENSLKIGIVISKKISPKAHNRNRIKRIVRALTKDLLESFPKNIKVVIYPKINVLETPYPLLLKEMKTSIEKI